MLHVCAHLCSHSGSQRWVNKIDSDPTAQSESEAKANSEGMLVTFKGAMGGHAEGDNQRELLTKPTASPIVWLQERKGSSEASRGDSDQLE